MHQYVYSRRLKKQNKTKQKQKTNQKQNKTKQNKKNVPLVPNKAIFTWVSQVIWVYFYHFFFSY